MVCKPRSDQQTTTSSATERLAQRSGESTNEKLKRMFPDIRIADEPKSVILTGVGKPPAADNPQASKGGAGSKPPSGKAR